MYSGDIPDDMFQALSSVKTEIEARSVFMRALRVIDGPGCALVLVKGKERQQDVPKGDFLWVDARYNKGSIPADTSAIDVATAILNALPHAVLRTVFSKTGSRRISKLFGISTLLKPVFRKVEKRNNLEPLEDIIVTTYWFKDNLFLLFSGVASIPSEEAVSDISALAMMYLKLWKEELLSIDKTKVETTYLSDIELEVLKWAAAGKSLKDIAEITGIKYRTVRYHLETARDKYGYATIQQTIVRASLDYGLDPLGIEEKTNKRQMSGDT